MSEILAMLCCCYTWIVFIEPNFTVAFLFIRKTWDDWFPGKLGGCGILRKGGGGDHSNGGTILKWREGEGQLDIPLWTMVQNSKTDTVADKHKQNIHLLSCNYCSGDEPHAVPDANNKGWTNFCWQIMKV